MFIAQVLDVLDAAVLPLFVPAHQRLEPPEPYPSRRAYPHSPSAAASGLASGQTRPSSRTNPPKSAATGNASAPSNGIKGTTTTGHGN